MSLFAKLSKKTTTDVTFEKVKFDENMTLENQDGRISSFGRVELEAYVQKMTEDYDQFVTLSLPKERYGIRFVQACQIPDGITVQLGLEENDKTRLVEKNCSAGECMDIFYEFFETGYVQKQEEYKPVEFMV